MADGQFVSADITAIAAFQEQSAEAIAEFAAIKQEFGRINSDLLASWQGAGADAYKTETDHILEKVGSVEDVLNTLNESTISDIRTTYSGFDDELGAFNENPSAGEEE